MKRPVHERGRLPSPCLLQEDPSPSHNSGKIIFAQICRALAGMLCLALPAQNQFYFRLDAY